MKSRASRLRRCLYELKPRAHPVAHAGHDPNLYGIFIHADAGTRWDNEDVPIPTHDSLASAALRQRAIAYIGSSVIVALCTGLAWWLGHGENLPATLMIFLIGVVAVAWRFGHGASFLACLLSLLSFDYFFETPAFTLEVANWPNLFIFCAMLLIAQLVAELVERLQEQVRTVQAQAAETDALYHLSLALSQATTREELVAVSQKQLRSAFGDGSPVEMKSLRQAFTVQIAQAQERVELAERARAALVEAERERTRSTLLSAVSHDLRTPLAAIQGAASSLLLKDDERPSAAEEDLLTMIVDESERLTRLVTNLIDMTRLESGGTPIQKDWQAMEEIIGAAITRLEARLGPLPVVVKLQGDLPLVRVDGVLVEQLLLNLIENAFRHAPGSPVEIFVQREGALLLMDVSDRGPGIPEDQRDRVFDKFVRMPSGGDGGVGLGLAICRAITQAHGGSIEVLPREGGGASFRVVLPTETDAPLAPMEDEAP